MNAAAEPFALEARAMADRLRERGVYPAAVGVVVNRVALAREIFTALVDDDSTEAVLMIGRSRWRVDRNGIAKSLDPVPYQENAIARRPSRYSSSRPSASKSALIWTSTDS